MVGAVEGEDWITKMGAYANHPGGNSMTLALKFPLKVMKFYVSYIIRNIGENYGKFRRSSGDSARGEGHVRF